MKCGCERGVNCTRTTMCALQSAVEDATEPLLERIAELVTENSKLRGECLRTNHVTFSQRAVLEAQQEVIDAARKVRRRAGRSMKILDMALAKLEPCNE